MHVLFVTSELAPLCQTGGLGDAVSGLARALAGRGHRVTCVLPAYRDALRAPGCPHLVAETDSVWIRLGSSTVEGKWLAGELFPGVEVALLDIPSFYARSGLYGDAYGDFADNAARYIALSKAAAFRAETDRPDVVVAHDHHAAFTIGFLRVAMDRGANRTIGTVQVVHNNAFQGRYPTSTWPMLGLPDELLHADGLEAYGQVCLLKAGLGYAERIVTVSPTYAREIQGRAMGEGLDGLYRARRDRLVGVVNGIDVRRFDPATDPALPARYDAQNPAGKAVCRAALLDELGLQPCAPGKLVSAIGRFAHQKGWDVLVEAAPMLADKGFRLAVLGDGDPGLRAALLNAAARHGGTLAVRAGYDEGLARRIYAGSDAVLVPSRFEPCGLVQLIAQRYGSVPVAHAVGGLCDTIHDPSFLGTTSESFDETATGVLFAPLSAGHLVDACERMAYAPAGAVEQRLRQRLMGIDVSWERPAARWEGLLTGVMREARGRA